MLRRLATVGLVTLICAAPASAAVPLTMRQARTATRRAAQQTADLLDAKGVNVQACRRIRLNRIDCAVRINGVQQTCLLRTAVIRVPGTYVVHGRDLHCQPRN